MPAPSVSMTWPQYLRREVTVDGKVHYLCPKQHALLFFVLVRGLASYEELTEYLWPDPDYSPDGPDIVFRTLKHRINKIIGPVLRTRQGFGLELQS